MKVYLVDESNNNKIIGKFESKKEAKNYIRNKFFTTNTNESKADFENNFNFVDAKTLEKKAREFGERVFKYYN